MKNILVITPGELPVPAVKGGAVETLIDILIEQNEIHGIANIDLFSVWDKELKDIRFHNGKIYTVKSTIKDQIKNKILYFKMSVIQKDWRAMFFRNHYSKIRYSKKLKHLLENKKYDSIVVENNVSLLKTVYQILGENKFRETCYFHMHSILVDNMDMMPYLQKCKTIIAVSNYVAERIVHYHPNLEDTAIKVLHNTIDFKSFSPEKVADARFPLRRKYNINDNEIVFMYSGRLSIEKGVKELLQAFNMIAVKNKRLVIVGGSFSGAIGKSQYEKELRKQAKLSGCKVTFLGFVQNSAMSQIYSMADVLVVPSLVEEAGCLTAIEGAMMKLKIVASNLGALPEHMGEYPLYVEAGSEFIKNLKVAMEKSVHYKNDKNINIKLLVDKKTYYKKFLELL